MARVRGDDFSLYAIVISFLLDNVVNAKAAIPVYVICIPLTLLVLFANFRGNRDRIVFLIGSSFLFLSFVINSLRFEFSVQDTSDVLFLIQFLAVFIFTKDAEVSDRALSISTLGLLALFLPAFVGFNVGNYSDDVFSSGSTDIEYLRLYNQGLYRLPHVAAYMLAFGALWWLRMAVIRKSSVSLALSMVFVFSTLYTGSRTPFFVFVVGYLISNFRLKRGSIIWIISSILLVFFFITFFAEILQSLYGTFLYQYVTLFQTMTENSDRLSRVIIWNSWLSAISNFDGFSFIFGRGFSNSFSYNLKEIGLAIWFHNDFMSMFYAYGIFGFLIYLVPHLYVLWIAFFRSNASRISMMCGFFISASAFINGFYKYMPILFLLLLFRGRAEAEKKYGSVDKIERSAEILSAG